jgi:hypothetical protein
MDGSVVETIYGKSSKYQITRKTSLFSDTRFLIYKDGNFFNGYDSLAKAVDAARSAG